MIHDDAGAIGNPLLTMQIKILKVTSSVEPRDLRHELKRAQQLEDSIKNGSIRLPQN